MKTARRLSNGGLALVVVLAIIAFHVAIAVPWRLFYLGAEMLVIKPGWTRTRAGVDHYWDCFDLQTRIENIGWTVEYSPAANESYLGLTNPAERTILVGDKLSWNARYGVLAHEGAHALQPARLSTGQAEVFAEAVAWLVVGDSIVEHARYLAANKADILMLVAYHTEIYRAAAMLRGE